MGSVTGKFKVGTLVRVSNPEINYQRYKDKIGYISDVCEYYQVRFDGKSTAVDDYESISYDYFNQSELELAKDFTHALTEIVEN